MKRLVYILLGVVFLAIVSCSKKGSDDLVTPNKFKDASWVGTIEYIQRSSRVSTAQFQVDFDDKGIITLAYSDNDRYKPYKNVRIKKTKKSIEWFSDPKDPIEDKVFFYIWFIVSETNDKIILEAQKGLYPSCRITMTKAF